MPVAGNTPPSPKASPAARLPLRLFDDGLGRFGPLTDLRPIFGLPAGGRTFRQRIEARLDRGGSAASPKPEVRGLWPRGDAETGGQPTLASDRPELVVNGRWDGLDADLAGRLEGLRAGQALLTDEGVVFGAVVEAAGRSAWERKGHRGLPPGCRGGGEAVPKEALVTRPWDLLDRLGRGIEVDARGTAVEEGGSPRWEHPASRVDASATVHPTACLDDAAGPVVIEAGAQVQAFALVEGPAWIGRDAVVSARAHLRGPAALGPTCKVGGEVKGALFGACSNKAHDGYLGDAVIGSWCNLGAGTTASNLKNTYGPVRVRLSADQEREDTGRTFLGPLLGDFVKTAIGTRLPTGCVVGTGACLAGSAFVPAFVPPMSFITDGGSRGMEPEAFLNSVRRQMARRGQAPSEALVARLRSMSVAGG